MLNDEQTNLRNFIENNRQTGSTTSLVNACLEVDGIIVTYNLHMKQTLLKNFALLKERNVYTIWEIKSPDRSRPLPKNRQIFIDASLLCSLG